MKRTASRTLASSIYICSVRLANLSQCAVVYVPLPEESSWLHVVENDDSTISPRLDFDGDGIGDLMIASDFSGVSLFTGRNVRLVTVGGVASNAAERTLLNNSSFIQDVGTWIYGNDVERLNPVE